MAIDQRGASSLLFLALLAGCSAAGAGVAAEGPAGGGTGGLGAGTGGPGAGNASGGSAFGGTDGIVGGSRELSAHIERDRVAGG